LNACGNERVATGTGAAVVRAGFERHISRGANNGVPFVHRVLQRHDFGMWAASLLRVALPYDRAIWRGDEAANAGIGVAEVDSLLSAGQCLQGKGGCGKQLRMNRCVLRHKVAFQAG